MGLLWTLASPVGGQLQEPLWRLTEIRAVAAQEGEPLPETASLSLRSVGSSLQPIERELAREPDSDVLKDTIALRPGRWVARIEAPGFWVPPLIVDVGTTERPHTVSMWQAGEVKLDFTLERGQARPTSLRVFSEPVDEADEAMPAIELPCPVPEKGPARCRLPAKRLNLRIQVPGFVPRYSWGVTIEPQEVMDLGRMALRTGSVLQAWVVTGDGQPLPEGITARAEPRGLDTLPDGDRRGRSFVAAVNADGFFEMDGLAPGEYVVEVEAEGYAVSSETVRVTPRHATELRDPGIVLLPAASLELVLSPPVDDRGRPWTVSLARSRQSAGSLVLEPVHSGVASETGQWTATDLAAGDHWLEITSSQGETVWDQELPITSGDELVWVDIPRVEVVGRVLLGDEPLAAEVVFGGFFGTPQVTVETDDEGELAVTLPRAGRWPVGVIADEPPLRLEIEPVEIPDDDDSSARVTLRVPSGALVGRTVDEAGRPVAGATVRVASLESRQPLAQLRSADDGTFEQWGFAPGPAVIEAESGVDLLAEPQLVTISEGGGPEMELVLRGVRRLTGVVSSAAGGVARAEVVVDPAGRPSVVSRQTLTDIRGRVPIRVPAGTEAVRVRVAAPGFAYRMLLVPLGDEERLGLEVRQESGTLDLDLPAEWFGGDDFVFLAHRGAWVSPLALFGWAEMHGVETGGVGTRRVTIPRMEPGDYALCRLPVARRVELQLGMSPGALGARCDRGTLVAEGALRLTLAH